MDVYKTPGAFSWNELMTTDPAAAGAFYAGLFGWAMKNMALLNFVWVTGHEG